MQYNSVHGKCDVIYCKVLQFNVKFNPIQTNKPTNAMQNDHPVGIGAKFSLGCLDIIRYQRNTIYYNAMRCNAMMPIDQAVYCQSVFAKRSGQD